MSKKISELSDASTLFPTTIFPLVNPEGTRKTTLEEITDFIKTQENTQESVASIAALAALETTNLVDGALVFVKSVRSYFTLNKTSTTTTDTVTTIAATSAGRWLRLNTADPSWATYNDWYVDPTNGNDEYDGTSATFVSGLVGPIKTLAELTRRWGTNILNPSVNVGTSRVCRVNLVNSIASTDPFNFYGALSANAVIAVIGGVASTLLTGTFTSVTAKNVTTNTPLAITDTALPSANSWAAAVNTRIRITSGTAANIGATSFVMKDLGTKQARITDFYLKSYDAGSTSWPIVTAGATSRLRTPVVGDGYAVETLKTVAIGSIRVTVPSSGINSKITFLDCTVTSGSPDIYCRGSSTDVTFQACVFTAIWAPTTSANSAFIQCCFQAGAFLLGCGGTNQFYLGLFGGGGGNVGLLILSPTNVVLDVDVMFQSCGIRILGAGVRISQVAIFDNVASGTFPGGHGIYIGAGYSSYPNFPCQVGLFVGNAASVRVWGSGNAGGGIAITGGCTLQYKSGLDLAVLTITGSTPGTNDLILNGATTARTWDETGGAFTTARTTSWANVKATIAGGGLAGNPQDVASGARLCSAA